jgi:hypothetical protein
MNYFTRIRTDMLMEPGKVLKFEEEIVGAKKHDNDATKA